MHVLNGANSDDKQPDRPVDQQLADCQRLVENLYISREHRGTIDQAIGILMAPGGLTADDAMKVLIQASQRQNRKLRDIAGDLVADRSKPATSKMDAGLACPAPKSL